MPIKNYTTVVPANRSIEEIQAALVKHGATGVLYEYEQRTGRIEALRFLLQIDQKRVSFSLPVNWRRFQAVLKKDQVKPRWTPENRPVVDGAKPTSGSAAPSTSVVPRPLVIEQVSRVGVVDAEGDTQVSLRWSEPAFVVKSAMRHHGVETSGRVPIAVQPGAPAARATGQHVRVMEQSVEERGDGP